MNQHVANLTAASTLTAIDLGAELQAASPEVRAAAVLRSQRLPKPEVMRDAWRSLPGSLQDRIGTAALTHSFYSRESQEDPCGLTLEAGVWAEKIETQALNEVEAIAMAALPELYGTDDAEPQWAISDAPLSFPNPLAFVPTKLPPKVRAEVTARSKRIPGLDDILAAWSRLPPTLQDQLGVQAVALVFYGWLAGDSDHQPADRWLTDKAVGACVRRGDKALKLLAEITERSLPGLFGTPDADPAWAQTAAEEFALALRVGAQAEREFKIAAVAPKDRLSPLQAAIELHRLAFDAKAARGDYEGDEPDDEWVALDGAEHDGLLAVLAAPVCDRADAAALVSHLSPFVKGELHPTLKDTGEITCGVLAKVLDACSVVLSGDGSVTAACRG